MLVLIGVSHLFANGMIEILPYKSNEFSPTLNQKFKIEFILKEKADIELSIYTPDNNIVRNIKKSKLSKGLHSIYWDGKDFNKVTVPNEAYMISLKAQFVNKSEVLDFRSTGGEVLKDLQTKVDRNGNITYKLSKPARVLVRSGIANSAMVREIMHWKPKNKGFIRQKWNLKDKDKVVDLKDKDFAVSVSAFQLPKYSILVQNNDMLSYRSYFLKNNLTCNKNKSSLITNKIRISQYVNICNGESREPKLYISFPTTKNIDNDRIILKNGESKYIRVTMDPKDESFFSKLKYEVSFFVDFEFVSEEEMGYMPIGWKYTPNGLKEGEHILTINVSSFSGQVGVKHIKFYVKENDTKD
jgi:hypothetical protein